MRRRQKIDMIGESIIRVITRGDRTFGERKRLYTIFLNPIVKSIKVNANEHSIGGDKVTKSIKI